MNSLIQSSKRLAFLLRHSSLPDKNGWVSTNVLIQEHGFTSQELEQIVHEDDKGRFDFSDDGLSIRALYGHSFDVDLELTPSVPPMILYHGTADRYIEQILKDGILPRKRKYVHLSETIEMARQVGARHGSPIVLSIDIKSMLDEGRSFYKAQRNVWLTDCVPAKYISPYLVLKDNGQGPAAKD